MIQMDDAALALHFKALAHPRRVRLFRLLAERPEVGRSFQALQGETGLCDSSLSHHLWEMERCGVIRRRRRGTFMTFTLQTAGLAGSAKAMLRLTETPVIPSDRAA